MMMKVVIVEDEKPASGRLIRLLGLSGTDMTVAAVLPSVEKAINWFLESPLPDLVFMDIQLEDGLCFEIFEHCHIDVPVIFTTAYDEYALQAFRVNSIDYLLKPIEQVALNRAVGKYLSLQGRRTDMAPYEAAGRQMSRMPRERFLIRIGQHYRPVPVSEINCFYILERNGFIQTGKDNHYPIDYSLDKIEQMVDPAMFFRINRYCIVNLHAISDIIAYSANRLKLVVNGWTTGDALLVSRERVAAFKAWMDR